MLALFRKLAGELRRDFWGTLAAWQNQRPLWLMGGGAALFLELFSWAYFQTFLGLHPCELCVYIRFSMVAVFFGAALAAIRPDRFPFKIAGYAIAFWGLGRGLRWDIALALDYAKAAASPWGILCSPGSVRFPFGLPLEEWLPGHFAPTALCGEDGWSLFGLNMAQWLFFVYGVFLVGLSLMLIAWLRRGRPPRP